MTPTELPAELEIFDQEQLVAILQDILDKNPDQTLMIDNEGRSEKGLKAQTLVDYHNHSYVFQFWVKVTASGTREVIEVIGIN